MATETTTTAHEINVDDGTTVTVNATYFQRDEGWLDFKNTDHKVVFSIRDNRVTWVKKADPSHRVVTVTLKADTSEYIASLEAAAKATKKLRDTRGA